jgi:hypothetical protein
MFEFCRTITVEKAMTYRSRDMRDKLSIEFCHAEKRAMQNKYVTRDSYAHVADRNRLKASYNSPTPSPLVAAINKPTCHVPASPGRRDVLAAGSLRVIAEAAVMAGDRCESSRLTVLALGRAPSLTSRRNRHITIVLIVF